LKIIAIILIVAHIVYT